MSTVAERTSVAYSPADTYRPIRRALYILHYLRLLAYAAIMQKPGIWQRHGRLIIWGKIRRAAICAVPGLPAKLQRKHGLTGSCTCCGASCNLLIQCPHWDEITRHCSIYDDRPLACRAFPITPADLRELALAGSKTVCGYNFSEPSGDRRS